MIKNIAAPIHKLILEQNLPTVFMAVVGVYL